MTVWFRSFIKDYAGLTLKLTESLKKNGNSWKWTEEMDAEFKVLKDVLRKMGKLTLPDYNKEFILETNASNYRPRAVLRQKNEKGIEVYIQWSSKKLTPTEVRYEISEKEMLAVY
ncbi:enzymatic polyprotein endonuclease reverse [Vairimorpha apis BRL 01]|uniref:Enzymatic polyprotein endonuclease reverse n=1 Tax=Vairimorpha apis BRL 01 TaxID=1037528 RepID=T0L4Q7_9MICR|nr:enzymatic polyprotein endonuclease reverse [Vairimorpha apis BRL 01]